MTRAERNRRAHAWHFIRPRRGMWWHGVEWRGGRHWRTGRLRPNRRAASVLLATIEIGERRAARRHAHRVDHALRRAQVRDCAARRYAA